MIFKKFFILIILFLGYGCSDKDKYDDSVPFIGTWKTNCLPNRLVKAIEFEANNFVITGNIYSSNNCSGTPYIVSSTGGLYEIRKSKKDVKKDVYEIDYNFKDGSHLYDIFRIHNKKLYFGDDSNKFNKESAENRPVQINNNEYYLQK